MVDDTAPTSVYRYYDVHGILIYVGITSRGIRRNDEHDERAAWWPYVARQEVDHLPSRRPALAHEKSLIIKYRPPFNTRHNPDAAALREAYVAFAATVPANEGPLEAFARLKHRLELLVARLDLPSQALELQTRPTDAAVARQLARRSKGHLECPALVHRQQVVGRIYEVDATGPGAVTVTARLNRFFPRVRASRDPIQRAVAYLRNEGNAKPPTFDIRYVEVFIPHRNHVLPGKPEAVPVSFVSEEEDESPVWREARRHSRNRRAQQRRQRAAERAEGEASDGT